MKVPAGWANVGQYLAALVICDAAWYHYEAEEGGARRYLVIPHVWDAAPYGLVARIMEGEQIVATWALAPGALAEYGGPTSYPMSSCEEEGSFLPE